MKELEAQIAGLDFDIGQEKQRNYTYLSPESVEKYLNSIICGDIQEMPVRKLIVKAFVREVILDNDNVTITYNFTENYTKYRVTQEIIQKVQRQSRKKTACNKNLCSYKLPPLPPTTRHGKICRAFLRFLRNSDAVPTVKNICTALVEFEKYLADIQNRYGQAENAKDNDTQKILLHTTLGHRHFLHFCIFPDKTPQTMHLTTKTAPFLKCLKQSS